MADGRIRRIAADDCAGADDDQPPVVLFTAFAGAVADTMDRRKVMLAAHLFLFVTALTLAVLARLGLVTPWMLLGFTSLTANFTDLSDKASTPLPGTINVAYDHAVIP